MDQRIDDVLMGLPEFRALTHLGRSAERKHRQRDDWAPHVVIGRRIFYRRAVVMEWLERRETNQGGAR